MDSILGKVIAAILVLLALAGVVVMAAAGYFSNQVNSAAGDVATMAAKIQGDYQNNSAGYASLTNQVAIAAGDVPGDMLKGSSIVTQWGNAVTIGPLSGYPTDFAIDLGAIPVKACAQLLAFVGNDLQGLSLHGSEVSIPADPAAAVTACSTAATAGLVQVNLQYGRVKPVIAPVVPPTGLPTNTYQLGSLISTGTSGFGYYWGSYYYVGCAPTTQYFVDKQIVFNASSSPQPVQYITEYYNNGATIAAYINGVAATRLQGEFQGMTDYRGTLQPGSNTVDFVFYSGACAVDVYPNGGSGIGPDGYVSPNFVSSTIQSSSLYTATKVGP